MKHLTTILIAVFFLSSVVFAADAYLGNERLVPEKELMVTEHNTSVESNVVKTMGTPNVPDQNIILQGGDTVGDATEISALPYDDQGTTTGYTDDYVGTCMYGGGAPDVVYEYTPDADMEITANTFGSSFDTGLYVYENSEGNEIACNDDSGGLQSEVTFNAYSGNTYYFVIDGYSSNSGDYIFHVEAAVPCIVECPPDGIEEGEPDCGPEYVDDYNGGCNSDVPIFQPIELYDIICGTSGTFLYGSSNYRDTDWFEYTAVDAEPLTFTAVGEFPILIFIIDAGSGNCSDYTIIDNASGGDCDTVSLTHVPTPGQTYWYWVGPSVFSDWDCPLDYVATLEGESGPEPQGDTCEDPLFIAESFPFNDAGNTCDFNDYCDILYSDNSDVIYEMTLTEAYHLGVSLENSDYDTKLAIYLEDCCTGEETEWAYNDDFYGAQSYIEADFPPGTYYVVVDGFGDNCGNYVLDIAGEIIEECDLECEEYMVEEGEPICGPDYEDMYNGGCNSEPPVFQAIGCEQTICGTSGTFLYGGSNYRDTDWFSLTLDQTEDITFVVAAEFPVLIFIIDAGSSNCSDYTIIDNMTGDPCDTLELSATLPAGDYWFWVGPSEFSGIECGVTYYATVMGCEPTSVEEVELVPTKIDMLTNYPNPFNAQTTIAFSIKESGNVSVAIYDVLGRTVDIVNMGHLVNDKIHTVNYDAESLSTGTYFYSLIVDGNKKVTQKFSLLK